MSRLEGQKFLNLIKAYIIMLPLLPSPQCMCIKRRQNNHQLKGTPIQAECTPHIMYGQDWETGLDWI